MKEMYLLALPSQLSNIKVKRSERISLGYAHDLPAAAGLGVRTPITMSKAASTFAIAIENSESLLKLFDQTHKNNAESAEVLKRAGLVIAVTAWETYVEDRLIEAVETRLKVLSGSPVGKFVSGKLAKKLTRLHNLTADKTKRLFIDLLDIDVTAGWKWANSEPASSIKALDSLLSKRGDTVHRAKPQNGGPPAPHLVKRDDLEKAIRLKRISSRVPSGLSKRTED